MREQEAREEVEDAVEGGGDDGCQLDIGRDGDGHHAVEGEDHERQEHEERVPEELGCTKEGEAIEIETMHY